MRFWTLALSLVPGAAQIQLGRALRGLTLFALFAFFLNGALVAPYFALSWQAQIGCALAAAGLWIAALVDALLLIGAARKAAGSGPPENGTN